MEITIKGTQKEIAGLVLELQNRQIVVTNVSKSPSSLTAESIYKTCRDHLAKEDGKQGTLYLCDPQKNKECQKEICQMPNGCFMTTNEAYAKIDADGSKMAFCFER